MTPGWLPGVGTSAPWHSHHRLEVMGTVVTFDLYCEDDVPREQLYVQVARARAVLQSADTVFSTWKEQSPINALRRGEITLAEAPAEVAQVLEACKIARSMSEGWFDPWAMPGGVDPTGYVKGWAAQRALGTLVMPGLTGAIVNAAGDIATFGRPGAGRPFRVGVVDPADRRRLACAVELTGAIATSGSYERGEHLVDPRTARAKSAVASASVTGPDLGLADALATALAVAGPEGLEVIEQIGGYEGFIIGYDASWLSTANFPFAPAEDAGMTLHDGGRDDAHPPGTVLVLPLFLAAVNNDDRPRRHAEQIWSSRAAQWKKVRISCLTT